MTQTQKVIQKVYPILALNHNLIRNQFQIRNPYLNHYQRPFLSQAQNQLRTLNQFLVPNLPLNQKLSVNRRVFQTL